MKKHSIKNISILFLSALSFSACKPFNGDLGAGCFEHQFDSWRVDIAATCINEGKETQVCSVCGKPQSNVHRYTPIDPNAHSWVDSVEDDKVATCTEDGVIGSKVCEHCGAKKPGETITKTGHNLGDWETTKEATATEKGLKERKCSRCDYVETEEFELEVPSTNRYPTENYYDGYYVPISSWENGEDLKNQLHALIRNNFTGLVYDGNWETNQMSEQSLTNFNYVNVIYSQKDDKKINTYGSAAGAAGWQREHAFCASLMTAYNTGEAINISNSGTSRATDFHNLFASYGAANGSRGNKNFGVYDPAQVATQSNAVDADTHADVKNYEPNDCDKGKLARAIFYMGVMYNEDENSTITVKYNYKNASNNSASKNVKINAKYKPLQIVENYVDYSQVTFTDFVSSTSEAAQNARNTYLVDYREDTSPYSSTSPEESVLADFAKAYSDYRYDEGSFAIGNLSTLLDWNSKEVDRQEMWHNETVYSYVHQNEGVNKGKKQGNRNPFVDYPELVDYVYGSKKDEPGNLGSIRPSAEDLYENPKEISNYALTSYKEKYLVGETLSSADYTLIRVNNDFSTQDIDFENTNQNYTFVESDIGQKTITLETPKGNISYVVNVESAGGVNACNYNFMISKDSFSATKVQTTPTQLLSYGGVKYNVSAGVADCPIAKKDTYAQIGNGTSYVPGTVTFETVDEFSYDGKANISAVYVGLNTASGKSYNYKIYIGDEEIANGSFSYGKTGPIIYGIDLGSPKTGKLKIVLSSCSAAVYISQISVKVN